MQTFRVEARRSADAPWGLVTTVQEDLVDEIAPMIPDGPGEWRLCPEDPEPQHPRVPQVKPGLPMPSRWDRLRWWFMLRFAPRPRR